MTCVFPGQDGVCCGVFPCPARELEERRGWSRGVPARPLDGAAAQGEGQPLPPPPGGKLRFGALLRSREQLPAM